MKRIEHRFIYQEFDGTEEIPNQDVELIKNAGNIAKKAYAPYSLFNVGAAIRLEDDTIVTGNNQENVAYPSGLCAERVALFYAKSQFPDLKIKEIAITAFSKKFEVLDPITPCGACRQALLEYENNQRSNIKVMLCSEQSNKVLVLESVKNLLPLSFEEKKLKNN
ncbi:MAG: cytidine deaminase [Patiriisocius sp.]|jgi:cytidine deaminase